MTACACWGNYSICLTALQHCNFALRAASEPCSTRCGKFSCHAETYNRNLVKTVLPVASILIRTIVAAAAALKGLPASDYLPCMVINSVSEVGDYWLYDSLKPVLHFMDVGWHVNRQIKDSRRAQGNKNKFNSIFGAINYEENVFSCHLTALKCLLICSSIILMLLPLLLFRLNINEQLQTVFH